MIAGNYQGRLLGPSSGDRVRPYKSFGLPLFEAWINACMPVTLKNKQHHKKVLHIEKEKYTCSLGFSELEPHYFTKLELCQKSVNTYTVEMNDLHQPSFPCYKCYSFSAAYNCHVAATCLILHQMHQNCFVVQNLC